MIDLVMGFADRYTAGQVRPFLKSLRESGYDGSIVLFATGSSVQEASRWGAEVRTPQRSPMPLCSARFFHYQKEVESRKHEGLLLIDVRDVLFQGNASKLPDYRIHAFEEDAGMTLGRCPYNSKWIRAAYGSAVLGAMSQLPIVCAGTTCGNYEDMVKYLHEMCQEIANIQPRMIDTIDQAVHNVVVGKDIGIRLWGNEYGPVYNVGYIMPRETVEIRSGRIVNKAGKVPLVIHQWDRHKNLSALVEGMF